MTELKTLKEIGFVPSISSIDDILKKQFMQEHNNKLRQEAIKHIKNCENTVDFTTNNKCGIQTYTNKILLCDVCNWIKYFFNISDDDLK